jgi:hypothetical protein
VVAQHRHPVRADRRHPLDELTAATTGIADDDNVPDSRRAVPSRDDEPIAGEKRGRHRPAPDRDGVQPPGGPEGRRESGRDHRAGEEPAHAVVRTGAR